MSIAAFCFWFCSRKVISAMKQVLCVILAVLLTATCSLSVFAAPAESVTYTLTANDAKVGETVTVAVSISENSYFTNATIYLHYNADAMKYVSDELGASAPKSAMYMSNNFADQGFVKMAYVAINGLTKGGELFVFTFEALSEEAAEFSMSFDECIGADDDNVEFDVNYTVVPCTVNSKGQTVPTKTTTTASQTNSTTATTNVTTSKVDDSASDETTTTVQSGETTTNADGTASTTKSTVGKTTTTTKKTVSDGKVEDHPKTGESSLAVVMVMVAVAATAVVGVAFLAKKIRD